MLYALIAILIAGILVLLYGWCKKRQHSTNWLSDVKCAVQDKLEDFGERPRK